MTELMGYCQRTKRTHGVDEQRMWAVKGVNISFAIGDLCPSRRLNSARDFESEFVKGALVFAVGEAAFPNQTQQIAVSRDVVETVIMHADVRDVRSHALEGAGTAELKETFLAGGIELKDGRAKLETLGPFGPATRGVFSRNGEHGRAARSTPRFFKVENFFRREFESAADSWQKGARSELVIYANCHVFQSTPSLRRGLQSP